MPILTGTTCTLYANFTASVTTILNSGKIEIVQMRIPLLLNNYFVTDLSIQDTCTFNYTARTIILEGNKWLDNGFASGDQIFIYNSYKCDGYKDSLSISEYTMTLATGQNVYDELSGRTIMFSVVNWPEDVKEVAAAMVQYDLEVRGSRVPGVKSKSLGPYSESYESGNEGIFGYPSDLISRLNHYSIARVM